jgi:hypothetical protein
MPDFLTDAPLIIRWELQFRHDDAPVHFNLVSSRYLNRKFPAKWKGMGGPIAWPPRSPAFNSLDFYLCGQFKSLLYSSTINYVKALRNRIWTGFQTIWYTLEILDRLQVAVSRRTEACIQAEVDLWNICCKVTRGAECHRQTLKTLETMHCWYKLSYHLHMKKWFLNTCRVLLNTLYIETWNLFFIERCADNVLYLHEQWTLSRWKNTEQRNVNFVLPLLNQSARE